MSRSRGTPVVPSGVLFPGLAESRMAPRATNQLGVHRAPTLTRPSVPAAPSRGSGGHGRLCHGLTPQHEEGSGSQHRAASRGREGESSRSTDRQHEARTDPLLPLATVSNPNQRVRFIAFCLPFDSRRRLPQFEGCRDSELNPARTWGGRFPEEHGTAQTGRHVAHSVYSAPAGPGALAEHGERYPNFILHFV